MIKQTNDTVNAQPNRIRINTFLEWIKKLLRKLDYTGTATLRSLGRVGESVGFRYTKNKNYQLASCHPSGVWR
jgi:hypothetical protein